MFDKEGNTILSDSPRENNTVINSKMWKRHRKLELEKHGDV
mgnify:CR=1 FL=1